MRLGAEKKKCTIEGRHWLHLLWMNVNRMLGSERWFVPTKKINRPWHTQKRIVTNRNRPWSATAVTFAISKCFGEWHWLGATYNIEDSAQSVLMGTVNDAVQFVLPTAPLLVLIHMEHSTACSENSVPPVSLFFPSEHNYQTDKLQR